MQNKENDYYMYNPVAARTIIGSVRRATGNKPLFKKVGLMDHMCNSYKYNLQYCVILIVNLSLFLLHYLSPLPMDISTIGYYKCMCCFIASTLPTTRVLI